LGFRAENVGLTVSGPGLRVSGLGLGSRAWSVRFRVEDVGFGTAGLKAWFESTAPYALSRDL
jgi:hypothetical protein